MCPSCVGDVRVKPTTIDEYIASKPEAVRPRLQELRNLVRSALPGISEAVKWGEPAFVDADGMILVMLASYKRHSNIVVTPSALAAKAALLRHYKMGKGSLQLPHDQPIPTQLIQELVEFRLREYRDHGVKWM